MWQELFLEHSAKRPVVVVAGVRVADLRAIMQFIYTGEVSVTEAGLADLLEVADMLGVRGLKAGAGAGQEAEQGPGREVRGDTEARVELSPASEAVSEEQSEEIVPNISITKVASPAPAPAPSSPEKKDPSPRPSDTFQISVKKDLTDQLLLGGSGDIASTAASPDLAAEDNIAAEDSEEAATTDTDKTASPLFPAAPAVPQFSPFSAGSFIRPHELGMSPLVSMSTKQAAAAARQSEHGTNEIDLLNQFFGCNY